jgi:TonB-dependent starch-binding outer membrane protein SusC
MNKRANLYFAALLGAMSPLCTVSALAAQSNSTIATATQQQNSCTGTVKDATGEPIIGATIRIEGKTGGTVTDLDGNFTLSNIEKGTKLTITYVGYKSQTLTWSGSPLNITLQDDANMLEETVVIGYGTVKKADLAGSVAVLDSKNFKDQPVARVEDALNGRMSGVQVMSSGVPGGAMKIRVRGTSSVNKSNDPLYVVDGIVRETGLEGISPEDIQSIQVLKDASSTAIYGARGANGVVMVQTKSGSAGATQVTFDASFGISNAYHIPEVMGTKEYAQALIDYKGVAKSAMQGYLDGTKPGIDWMDELLQTGITQNYKVAVSQGNEKTQTYFSANYMDQKGVITDTKSRRYAIKANMHNKIFDWLEMTTDINLAQTDNSGAGFAQNQSNPIWVGLNYSPTMEMMAPNGNYNVDPYNCIQNNPYGILHDGDNDRKRTMVTGHIDLKFNLLKGLTFTTTNGIDYNDYKWYDFTSTRVNVSGNSMTNGDATVTALQSTNNLTYMGKWGEHALTATGVWEVSSNEVRKMQMTGTGIAHEQLGYWNIQDAASKNPTNGYSKWTMLSGVARVMYNYADRYMLTGTFRADGSSRFTNKKWGYFPSIAGAWTVSNEKFWEPIRNAVEYMKIRASYGIIGNQDIAPYSTLGTLKSTGFSYGTNQSYTGYWANSFATPDLTWEKVHQFDLGVDLGFFGNRLNISFDYFNKTTKDALLQTAAPGYLGATQYWVNAGEVNNKGVDVTINGQIIQTKDWSWSSTLNASYIKNKVTKMTADEPIIYGEKPAPGTVDPCTIIKEGEAIGTFYGFKWAGVEKNDKGQYVDMYYAADGTKTASPNAGKDRFVLGRSNPDVTLGWNNTITYKNWDFNMFCNAAFGAKRLNIVRFAMNAEVGASRFVTDKDHFSNIGITMPSIGAENKNYGNSDKWLENADYFRCENISVAYTFPRSVTKLADIRLSLSAQNLFTITGYKGIDPAGASFSDANVDRDNGLDMGAYPNPRTITMGVRVTF